MKKSMNKGFFIAVLATATVFTSCSNDKDTTEILGDKTPVSITETGPLTGPMKAVGAYTAFTAWTQDKLDPNPLYPNDRSKDITTGYITINSSTSATCTLNGNVDVPRAELSDDAYWQQAGKSTVTVTGTYKCTLAAGETTGCGSIFQVLNHVDNGSGGYSNRSNFILYAYDDTKFCLATDDGSYRQYLYATDLGVTHIYGTTFTITVIIYNDQYCRSGVKGKVRVKIGAKYFPDMSIVTQGDKGAAIKVGAYSTRSGNKALTNMRWITGTTTISNLTVTRVATY